MSGTTMGAALSRASPLLGGIDGDSGSIGSKPPGDLRSDTGGSDDGGGSSDTGLRDVLGRNKDQITALQRRLGDLDARSDAMVPPKMIDPPKPPEQHDTPMEQRWGSVAMTLAAFGGLLTRTPLTASLNAMAQVNHAFNEGDATAAKNAFDTWKVQNENAMKMNAFSIKAYEDSLRKISTDRQGALAEIRANAAALKDDVVLHLLDSGQTDAALGVLGARPQQTAALADRTEKLQQQHDALTYWKDNFKQQNGRDPNPQEFSAAAAAFRAGKDPDAGTFSTTAPTQLEVTGEDGQKRTIYADRDKKTGGWVTADENRTPIHSDASGGYRILKPADTKPLSASAAAQKDTETTAAARFKEENGRDPGPEDEPKMAMLRRAIKSEDKAGEVGSEGDVDKVAKQIAEYKLPPLSGFVLKSRFGQQVMAKIADYNPDYSATQYGARQKAERDFSTGTQGNAIRSFNVAISHLGTLEELATALNNGNIQGINRYSNLVSGWTGGTAPTNFEAARQIVSQEIIKSIIASGGGVTERQEAEQKVSTAQSPAQLLDLVKTYKQLMAGQLRGLKQQYEQTTGRKDFDDRLSDETKQQLGEGSHSVHVATSEAEYAAMPKGTWWRKPGDPIDSHRVKP